MTTVPAWPRVLAHAPAERARGRHRLVAAALALVAGTVVAGPASAASLGGAVSASIFTQTSAAVIMLGLTDSFDGTASSSLGTHPADTGQSWTQAVNGFVLTGTKSVKSTTNSGTAIAVAPTGLDAGSFTAGLTLTQPNNPACCGGLYLLSTSNGTSGISLLWYDDSGGRLTLAKRAAGTVTVLRSWTGVGSPAAGVAMLLEVTYLSGTFSIEFLGLPVGTYTLAPADLATYGGNTYAGIAVDANNKIQLSALRVTP
jgi:hypothetical protein